MTIHETAVEYPLSMVSLNFNLNIVILRAEARFVRRHNGIRQSDIHLLHSMHQYENKRL